MYSWSRLKRNLFLLLIFAVLLAILWVIYTHIKVFPLDDFVEYWASGRLNLTGGNPYNADQMLTLEQSVGWENEALMMLNPPWILPFAMFFGIFSYPLSRFLCFLVQIGIVGLCSSLLWKFYNGNKHTEWMSWIALLSFGPMLRALKSGQVTILVLLGSVGFLYFINKKSDFLAGILVSLVLIKPHLLYLLVLAVIFWSILHRRYNVLIGITAGLVASLSVAWIINPRVISQYILMVRYYPLEIWMTSTLGSYLRVLFGSEKVYLQFIPSVVGITWFLVYWLRNHKSFDWITHLPMIILISLATSAYGWMIDSALSVWAIIPITILFDFSHWTFKKILVFIMYWGINLLVTFLSVSQNWFWWLPIFLLIWYLLSYKYLSSRKIVSNKPDLAVIT